MSATGLTDAIAVPRTRSAVRRPLLVSFVGAYAVFVLVSLPAMLTQDSWLTLVSGREIVRHGLPFHDNLAVWTHGAPWIDQQWLAQLVFYGLTALGGVKLALLVHALVAIGAMALAVWFARRSGATDESVFVCAGACAVLAPWGLELRAQSFAVLLFVAVLGLLAEDARRPSRRVFWVFPLLVLWANLHGTVVLGAALVALRGALALRRRWLLLLAPACTLVSPYGFSLVGYYHHMLANPLMSKFIEEWKPSTPGPLTAPFWVAAFGALLLLGRHAQRITWFERLALVAMLVAGATAIRSIVWFALALVLLVPQLLDGSLGTRRSTAFASLWRPLAVVVAGCAVALFAATAARPASWFEREWPAPAAGAAVSASTGEVLSDDRYSDWLLWEHPELRGRIAYDIRFELLTPTQFTRLAQFRTRVGDDWRRAGRKSGLLVFDPRDERKALAAVAGEPGARVVYHDAKIAVVQRCTITGTEGNDQIIGTSHRDVICGLGGNDVISGAGGNDVLVGGPGNDTLEGGSGMTTFLGGPGNDTIYAWDGGRDIVDGGPGIDTAWTDRIDVVRSIERHN